MPAIVLQTTLQTARAEGLTGWPAHQDVHGGQGQTIHGLDVSVDLLWLPHLDDVLPQRLGELNGKTQLRDEADLLRRDGRRLQTREEGAQLHWR